MSCNKFLCSQYGIMFARNLLFHRVCFIVLDIFSIEDKYHNNMFEFPSYSTCFATCFVLICTLNCGSCTPRSYINFQADFNVSCDLIGSHDSSESQAIFACKHVKSTHVKSHNLWTRCVHNNLGARLPSCYLQVCHWQPVSNKLLNCTTITSC